MTNLLINSATGCTPQIPDALTPYLDLLTTPPIPICRICRRALLPHSILEHLRKQHQLPVSLRSTVRSLITTLSTLCITDITPQPDGSAPIEALRVVEAFQCKRCGFIRRDVTDVRKHVNVQHEVSAAGAYEQIQAQSWFGGSRAVYWRVCAVETRALPETPSCLWGFYGKGFGERQPKSWREVAESEEGQS